MQQLEDFFNAWADIMWSTPLVVLLVGGGLFFMVYSRFQPYRYFGHAIDLLRGKYSDLNDPGHIPHSQALSTALSGTLGLGNIAGVAIAISIGGPGAVFWMWVTAIVGVATKFYTASLAVMYRGKDSSGILHGGPMYVIMEGMGKRWYPLAALFAGACLIGALPIFQANQFIQLLRDVVAIPAGWASPDQHFTFDLVASSMVAILVSLVIIGRIERIGRLTVRLVPSMVLLYLFMTVSVLYAFAADIPATLLLIVTDAFTGEAAAGGSIGAVILIGVRRGAFSNEAGIGTESLAHGAAKTAEPIREGIVAMVGPVIDTLVVCTCTALIILLTGVWETDAGVQGVTLTARAIEQVFPVTGTYLLLVMVGLLSFSTMVTMWFYGVKCMGFLFGSKCQYWYSPIYIALLVGGAVVSMDIVNGLILATYATMAIPTMISALYLSPKVNRAAKAYFAKLDNLDK
ncbi:MAG: sodium:alanine symporter family protein [Porticoccaceae bacterium]|nr:sodium:alanine symporter family protein [Porticoccaceae bacterium]MBT5004838.1 sodium:alanine symporter family protein [Porticoccaceae bacterium]MBT6798446.1 sodium:alanine symporter family protein [Porticoccaceae bacterium]MBT7565523.1 sodium:alanine symporter family protein [Porticoccaceae bacterium]MBT7963390.1 sodium:alanine symporter family protein [Porticoccaceae bacterium]